MTYRESKVFRYDLETLTEQEVLQMPEVMQEGWGLTHNDTHLIASDGSSSLFIIDP